ncbi:hypothetical protein [Streptomyces tateyamensis]|nr:hypothetical protein [Streptomyces tateyamensis]
MPRFAALLLLAVLAVGFGTGAAGLADSGAPHRTVASDGYGWGSTPQTP